MPTGHGRPVTATLNRDTTIAHCYIPLWIRFRTETFLYQKLCRFYAFFSILKLWAYIREHHSQRPNLKSNEDKKKPFHYHIPPFHRGEPAKSIMAKCIGTSLPFPSWMTTGHRKREIQFIAIKAHGQQYILHRFMSQLGNCKFRLAKKINHVCCPIQSRLRHKPG